MTGSHRRPPWAREETAKEQEVQKLKWPGDGGQGGKGGSRPWQQSQVLKKRRKVNKQRLRDVMSRHRSSSKEQVHQNKVISWVSV